METPLLKQHGLLPTDANIEAAISNPAALGLNETDFTNMPDAQKRARIIAEYYYNLWLQLGYEANNLLMNAYWGGPVFPNFFDHRSHLLYPDTHIDYWTLSSDLALRHLPLDGKLLSLCSGDGFYEYNFYAKRASEVLAIDQGAVAMNVAKRIYQSPKITYKFESIFEAVIPPDHFDTVVMRSAIEHFSLADQIRICELAYKSLKPGGYFVGDTPAAAGAEKLHTDHENEWKDEAEMRAVLLSHFKEENIETSAFVSKDRTILFWACRK
jgi:SAM-dependent methyltransferase